MKVFTKEDLLAKICPVTERFCMGESCVHWRLHTGSTTTFQIVPGKHCWNEPKLVSELASTDKWKYFCAMSTE